jgi:hypothetical protein
MELIKLPLHQETIELLKLQGVTFLGDDETFYFRGKDEVKDKWGTFELGLYTEMDIENKYDEDRVIPFHFQLSFNGEKVATFEVTPKLLNYVQLAIGDRITNGEMAKALLDDVKDDTPPDWISP